MKKVKFSDGSYTVLAIKSDLFAGEGDGIFDPNGRLLKARIRFPSGMARSVSKRGAVWNEIESIGGTKARKKTSVRRPLIPRPKAVRRKRVAAPAAKPSVQRTPARPRGRRISREEQYRHDFQEEQKAIAARIRGETYVPKRYPEPTKSESGTYRSFGAWASAVRRAGGVVRSQLSEPQLAYNRSGQMIGEWDGQEGMIIQRNPVRRHKGESEREFVSRCMSEEKMKFPKQKQRIAVCLSKVRRNPFPDRNADE